MVPYDEHTHTHIYIHIYIRLISDYVSQSNSDAVKIFNNIMLKLGIAIT